MVKLQHQDEFFVVLDCFFRLFVVEDRSVVGVAHEEERLSEGRCCNLFGEQSANKR